MAVTYSWPVGPRQKCREAMVKIKEEIGAKYLDAPKNIKLDFLYVDMNNLSKAQAAISEGLKRGPPLHILINNSAIGGEPWTLSADGIEQQFA
ncbi:hypothetical protein BGX26_004991, partial [Mortierella sp. AD094]